MPLFTDPVAARTTDIAGQVAPGGSKADLEVLETLFAGLSVLIGGLALVIGLLQLHWYRRRHGYPVTPEVFELEAVLPYVSDDS